MKSGSISHNLAKPQMGENNAKVFESFEIIRLDFEI